MFISYSVSLSASAEYLSQLERFDQLGICVYAIVHTISPPRPVIFGRQSWVASQSGLYCIFWYHDAMRMVPIRKVLNSVSSKLFNGMPRSGRDSRKLIPKQSLKRSSETNYKEVLSTVLIFSERKRQLLLLGSFLDLRLLRQDVGYQQVKTTRSFQNDEFSKWLET